MADAGSDIAHAALVALRGVGKTYGDGALAVRALRDVDLEIARGELVVVLGSSGSGKTTLLNVIGAIESATTGTVRLAGRDLTGLGEEARTAFRRRAVGFVFQFFNLIPTLTALENVELIAEIAARTARRTRIARCGQVGLVDRLDHFPAQLSGGEQQRAAVARALVAGPQLLLRDEPTGAQDLETGRVVLGLLEEVGRESGRTVVMVTHNAAVAGWATACCACATGGSSRTCATRWRRGRARELRPCEGPMIGRRPGSSVSMDVRAAILTPLSVRHVGDSRPAMSVTAHAPGAELAHRSPGPRRAPGARGARSWKRGGPGIGCRSPGTPPAG